MKKVLVDDVLDNNNHNHAGLKRDVLRPIQQGLSIMLFSFLLNLSAAGVLVPTASAADYNSLSDEQKAVAEAWRLVDYSYLDRTFNGQDWFKLRQNMVKAKYKSSDEAQSAIASMVGTLGDRYTRYLSPAKYQSIVDSATGTLAGVGVEISTNKQGQVIVADVEPNSPAFNAGLQPDDVFIEVDGTRFVDVAGPAPTPDDVATKLRGPEGSRVGVTVSRSGDTVDYIVTRKPIKITSVKSYMSASPVQGVDGKVGVIRIKSFSGTTASTVQEQYSELAKNGAKAFVLDVRGNPGGLLPGGVETASLFLDNGKPVVYVVDKRGVIDAQSTLKPGIDMESPLIVLVDSNTASAAEVFAAALKENDRAVIAGEQTFGKAVIQTIRGLSNNNGGIAITVARYETPKRNDINKAGIAVNLPASVECPKTDATACLPPKPFAAQ